MTLDEIDGTGLIIEAYRIEGIGLAECRTIFMDWALKLPEGISAQDAVTFLHREFGRKAPDHPMTEVLREGMTKPESAQRRGGRKARVG